MAVVKFKNGAIATDEGTTNVYPKNLEETLYIFGEKGTVKIGRATLQIILMSGILRTNLRQIQKIKDFRRKPATYMETVIQACLQT